MLNRSRIIALLAFAAASTAMIPAPAHAQKPALVQNIDEKGRNPYQQGFQFNATTTTTLGGPTVCASNNNTCLIFFKPVPAGYRLVVTHISFTYTAATVGADSTAALLTVTSTTAPVVGDISALPAPTFSGSRCDLSAPITFYVEPGLIPTLDMSNVLVNNTSAIVSITGYLVNLNE
jgi:hypothetical protein